MRDDKIKTEVADQYFLCTPENFEKWLQEQERSHPEGSLYGLILSSYLAGSLNEDWFAEFALSFNR